MVTPLNILFSYFCLNGLFQKKSTPPGLVGFLKFSWEEGSKTLEIQVGGGLNIKKSSAGVISTDSSRDSNVSFGDTSPLPESENSRNILFTITYFSPNINDNLSSFTGFFKAENLNKTLKNELSQRCYNEEFERPDTFSTRTQTQRTTVV